MLSITGLFQIAHEGCTYEVLTIVTIFHGLIEFLIESLRISFQIWNVPPSYEENVNSLCLLSE